MRRFVPLIPALALALVLGACGSDDSSTTTTTTEPTTTVTEPTTTTVTEPTTTTVTEPTTTTAGGSPDVPTTPIEPGADADADAIAEVYAVVFDSSVGFEDKAPLIDDPTGLETTVDAYGAAGEAVGRITLAATAVGVDGDDADVIYDLYFGENPFQTDQAGSAVRTDGTWQVTRSFFCSIMELARVGCP
jgi:hypothetical protein